MFCTLVLILQLWVISSPAFLVVFMATFGVCSSVPPTPPTASAEEESEPFKEGLKKVCILCVLDPFIYKESALKKL